MKSNFNIFIINCIKIVLFLLFFLLQLNGISLAQSLRGLVNEGVDKYNDKKFGDSEVNFKKGMDKDPNNFNSFFNLGDAQYKQQRFDEAVKTYNQALAKTIDKDLKAKTLHNIGNAFVKSKKYNEGIEAYKKSLKFNPYDRDTKYNLSYALDLLKQQQQQNKDQNDKNNKDKNNQKQNDKNNQDNKDQNKDQDKQNKQQNQEAQKDNTKQQNKQNQQSKANEDKNKMSKQEAEQILNAMKNNELELQKQLRKHEGKKSTPEQDW